MTKEHLSPDLLELLATLHRHRAQVVVVGGEAVVYHGYPRFTGDLDLFYDRRPAGAALVFAALLEFWHGAIPSLTASTDLEPKGVVVQLGRPPNRVDLLSDLRGVSFKEAWETRVQDVVSLPSGDLPIGILALPLLLKNKAAVGRAKDLDDLAYFGAAVPRVRPPL